MQAASPSDASARPTISRPTVRFMVSHPAHLIALGFGSGLARRAPGTVGTLWAWVVFLVMQLWLSPAAIGWVMLAALPIGWWACSVTARDMNISDPGPIVWDEVLAFWLILWLIAPAGLLAQLAAFGIFRFFDAVKPQPVKWADGCMKERPDAQGRVRWSRAGFGILLDDFVAAFCTLLVIALGQLAWRWMQS